MSHDDALTKQSPVFVLTGMGRSGTSLSASLLQSGGVNMGSRQLGAHAGNSRGHFENVDFLDFHRDIFRDLQLHDAGWISSGAIQVPAAYTSKAREFIALNSATAGPAGWGWKDPRTTLFLEFWNQMLPDAHFIFIYRSPWEVIDSIFRRGVSEDLHFRENPQEAVSVWCHYNRVLLDFLKRHPQKSLLVSCDAVAADPTAFVRLANARFSATIAPPPPGIVDPQLLHRQVSGSSRPSLVVRAFPEVLDLLQALDELCAMRSPALSPESLAPLRDSRDFSSSFHDWFDIYQAKRDLRKARPLLRKWLDRLKRT